MLNNSKPLEITIVDNMWYRYPTRDMDITNATMEQCSSL